MGFSKTMLLTSSPRYFFRMVASMGLTQIAKNA